MSDTVEAPGSDLVDLTVDIVSAYLSNNRAPASDLPGLIASVHAAVSGLGQIPTAAGSEVKLTPAQIRKSITPDALISFEDGKAYKTLRRHLTTRGMTPESYREKWGLPLDYPMVSTSYSEQRSSLAKSTGLGQQRRKPAPKAAATAEQPSKAAVAAEAPKKRGAPMEAAAAKPGGRRKAAEPAATE